MTGDTVKCPLIISTLIPIFEDVDEVSVVHQLLTNTIDTLFHKFYFLLQEILYIMLGGAIY